MRSKLVPRGVAAALAAAALAVAVSASPSPAFTLSGPSLAAPVAGAGVEHVWWDRWGRWHPNHAWGYRPWGPRPWGWGGPRPWGPRPWGYYGYAPVRHCWVNPWGAVRCRWG